MLNHSSYANVQICFQYSVNACWDPNFLEEMSHFFLHRLLMFLPINNDPLTHGSPELLSFDTTDQFVYEHMLNVNAAFGLFLSFFLTLMLACLSSGLDFPILQLINTPPSFSQL